jgi:hypothetical protein
MQRVPPEYVEPALTNLGVDWLTDQWNGMPELPKELMDVVSTRALVGMQRGRPLAVV